MSKVNEIDTARGVECAERDGQLEMSMRREDKSEM